MRALRESGAAAGADQLGEVQQLHDLPHRRLVRRVVPQPPPNARARAAPPRAGAPTAVPRAGAPLGGGEGVGEAGGDVARGAAVAVGPQRVRAGLEQLAEREQRAVAGLRVAAPPFRVRCAAAPEQLQYGIYQRKYSSVFTEAVTLPCLPTQ